MATNKNQHFVPRCYLRLFTIDADNKAINLYNIDRDKFVNDAPVKNQCSGDYFYGKDPLLEDAIQSVERPFSTVVREILQPGYKLTVDHQYFLKLFWLFQNLRTEAASRRSVEMMGAFNTIVATEEPVFRVEIKEAVQMAMSTFPACMDQVSDLKVCLIRNRSATPFVTSDDPAVLSNRWHIQYPKRVAMSFGIQKAGALLFLPLSPTVLFLAYDGDMHTVDHHNGWVELRHDVDVDAFNQHQYLNCRANIFIRDSAHFASVRESFKRVADLRPPERYRMHYAVLDKEIDGYKQYVVVDHTAAVDHEDAFIHMQLISPIPPKWPRLLKWRVGAFAFYNGTGAGYVRKAFVSESKDRPFKKVRVF